MTMDPNQKIEKQRAAKQRLRAQQERTVRLRGRVIVVSLIAFVVLWAVVFAQMATGNDPVLKEPSKAVASKKRGAGHAANPAETGVSTDAEEEAELASELAAEEIESSSPEEFESEIVEETPIEEEPVEQVPVEEEFAEVEPEPEPVITGQS